MISIKSKVDGYDLNVLQDYVKKLPVVTQRKLYRTILSSAIEVQGEAFELITRGPARSGRISRRGKSKSANRRKGLGRRTLIHQASAPGEPAKSDTGILAGSIFHDGSPAGLRASVGSVVLHGLFTEKGTTKMRARPWLAPSFDASRPSLERRLADALREI